MKKLTYTLNALWTLVILVISLSIQGMKANEAQLALQAEQYNTDDCVLTKLPDEKLIEIFSHCLTKGISQKMFLIKSVQTLIRSGRVCKTLHRLLTAETIGKLCKKYNTRTKNDFLYFFRQRQDQFYLNRDYYNFPILASVYAGANDETLLTYAILNKNIQLIKALLDHKVNPNRDNGIQPDFFYAPTKEIAQMLIQGGAHIETSASLNGIPNVLWAIVGNELPSELIQLYLDNNINIHATDPYDKSCILHKIGYPDRAIYNPDNFLKQATLLLQTIPDMVNTLNIYGKTPLDLAQRSLSLVNNDESETFKKLIILFRAHDGKTAQELSEMKK